MRNNSYGRSAGRSNFRPQFSNNRGRRQAPKRRSFDPSMFVKKAVERVEEVFTPTHSFTDFALHPQLQKNIVQRGYTVPTPIQDQAIPHLLEGKDMIGLANTGTGKTAAFLIPLVQKVALDDNHTVLIVTPTRELAVQIEEEFLNLAKNMQIYSAVCIGGVNIRPQMMRLRRQPHFVIGTPGRLRDLEKQRAINFNVFNTIVFDEVDRMFDMGFINDVRHITSQLPENRHSLFFSATLTDALQSLMRGFLKDPVKISVKSREAAANVDQDIIKMNGKPKIEILNDLLQKNEFDKVLIFSRTKHGTENLAQSLNQRGFSVGAIHGNKNQNQRQRAIQEFKNNRIQVLVATDVASRGLDIQNVSHVINYDLPETYEDYIHRIGRTGRANQKGTALTFID